MRNITRSLGLIIGATLLFSSCLPSEATTDNMKLWYDKPADEWMKSLPLGNGRLGAMVYGGVETETIGLNESTMWSGYKSMLYLTATGRNDWESQLAFSEASSFFYPSVGLSGIISSMVKLPDWLSYLKVRGSYTEVGTSFERFITRPTYEFNIASGKWSSTSIYPVRNLKPEKTRSWEVGVNSKWLNNHLSFDVLRRWP